MTKELRSCPCCGGEATFYEFRETVDGRGDELPKVICDCGLQLKLTYNEYHKMRDDFNYKCGYITSNKELLSAINQKVIEKWNTRKPIDKIVEQLEAEEYDVNCNICDYDSEIDTNTLQYYEGKEDGIRSVIEILKGGAE